MTISYNFGTYKILTNKISEFPATLIVFYMIYILCFQQKNIGATQNSVANCSRKTVMQTMQHHTQNYVHSFNNLNMEIV